MARHYYDLCCRNRGRAVVIRDRNGNVYRGIIDRVTPTHVYLRPPRPPRPTRNLGGFGYGFVRPYYGGGYGFGWAAAAIALAAIAAFTIAPFGFFW